MVMVTLISWTCVPTNQKLSMALMIQDGCPDDDITNKDSDQDGISDISRCMSVRT